MGMTQEMTISGPIHPLAHHIRKAHADRKRAIERWKATATAIRQHQHLTAESGEGIYEVSGPGSWRYVGPAEQHRHLCGQTGYYAATARGGYETLALQLAGQSGKVERGEALHRAAWAAAPMVAATLGLGIAAGTIEWDTGESVSGAALRISRDAAWAMMGRAHPDTRLVGGHDIYAAALAGGYVPAEIASAYLARRDAIAVVLDESGIEWGGALLDSQQASERARLSTSASAWRSYVARGIAPTPDGDRRWRTATVDAWMLSRPVASSGPTGW
jgi:hypothetical protein